jgi:hypothetical protein
MSVINHSNRHCIIVWMDSLAVKSRSTLFRIYHLLTNIYTPIDLTNTYTLRILKFNQC